MRKAALSGLWALVLVGGGIALGEEPKARSADDPRRTPAVDIFQRQKNSVIYLIGPSVVGKGQLQLVEEFFEGKKNREATSLGTGFFIHESGYLLTNAHTVEKVISFSVVLENKKKYPAELLSVERNHDMALLKINAEEPLIPVHFGKSNDVMVGEPVIVIGNPFGLPLSCSTGVISAISRAMQPNGLPGVVLHNMLQTDASINVGSSGGPWFNALGEVIGMTAVKRMNSDNIAFGVPTATLRTYLPDMLDIERRQGFQTGLKLSPDEPAQVLEVEANSPASKAGIQQGDVIEQLDGKPLIGRLEFYFGLIGRKPNDVLRLNLVRDKKPVEASLTLKFVAKPDGAALLKARCGLVAVPLDEAKAEATGMRVHRGVVITEVLQGPPWNYEKLNSPPMAGDVLARLDGIRPQNLDEIGLLLDRLQDGQSLNAVLLRRNNSSYARIDLTTVVQPVTAPAK